MAYKGKGNKDAVGGSGSGFSGTHSYCHDMKIATQDASRKLKGPDVGTGATAKNNQGFQKPLGPRVA